AAGLALLRGRWRRSIGWHALAFAIPVLIATATALFGSGGPAPWIVAVACAVPLALVLAVPGGRGTARAVSA
ncbi:MAG: hypothetical protein ACKO5K_10075, partial [Armatimonadota bacterium]